MISYNYQSYNKVFGKKLVNCRCSLIELTNFRSKPLVKSKANFHHKQQKKHITYHVKQ